MALASTNVPLNAAAAGKLRGKGIFAALREGLQRYRIFTRTRRELNELSSRELADLGISRSGITRVALEAAYGKDV